MKRRVLAGLLSIFLVLSLAACGGSGNASPSADSSSAGMATTESSAAVEEPMAQDMGYGGSVNYEAEEDIGGEGQTTGQKLIRTAWLELETTSFDEAVRGLEEVTEEFDGYFENSSMSNRRSGARYADYTVRVPAERYNDYLNRAGELCHLIWRETSQDDVSEVYYDTAGRLKTQQIKLERLQALLAKAELMEDIITIESAISETEWQIDELSGTLRHYDGKVNYATVHITLSEVYKLSDVEEVPDSFGERMSAAFSGGLAAFADNMENLAVAFAYSWMWWLLLAVIVIAVVRIVLWRRRKAAAVPPVRKPPFWNPKVRKTEDDKPE